MKSLLRDTLAVIIIAAIIIFGLQLTAQKFVIEGPSMNPTFHDGQQVLVNKLIYKIHKPQRGDVIIFYPPINGSEEYIKRVIGLPGEYVQIQNGIVYIHQPDGTVLQLTEPYEEAPADADYTSGIIPPDHYFVMGDNRNNSSDSRGGWTVPLGNITGKAWLSIWPPSKWGIVTNHMVATPVK